MIRNKTEDVIKFNNGDPGMDLLGHLVRTKYAREEPTKVTSSGTEKQSGGAASGQLRLAPEPLLSDSEIIGNAFIMFIAGHETTANATHFTAVHLAARPASQRAVQRDIDNIFDRDSNPASWKYEDCINPMSASMIGASLNETLRLIPAAGELPKRVNPERDGIVTINGQRHALPGNAHILDW
ncbi:Cytochrome 3A12 like protein [Verticillium longisporum]|nr:Cytochrome 3A12 like protein [Verticillium longisporum]